MGISVSPWICPRRLRHNSSSFTQYLVTAFRPSSVKFLQNPPLMSRDSNLGPMCFKIYKQNGQKSSKGQKVTFMTYITCWTNSSQILQYRWVSWKAYHTKETEFYAKADLSQSGVIKCHYTTQTNRGKRPQSLHAFHKNLLILN